MTRAPSARARAPPNRSAPSDWAEPSLPMTIVVRTDLLDMGRMGWHRRYGRLVIPSSARPRGVLSVAHNVSGPRSSSTRRSSRSFGSHATAPCSAARREGRGSSSTPTTITRKPATRGSHPPSRNSRSSITNTSGRSCSSAPISSGPSDTPYLGARTLRDHERKGAAADGPACRRGPRAWSGRGEMAGSADISAIMAAATPASIRENAHARLGTYGSRDARVVRTGCARSGLAPGSFAWPPFDPGGGLRETSVGRCAVLDRAFEQLCLGLHEHRGFSSVGAPPPFERLALAPKHRPALLEQVEDGVHGREQAQPVLLQPALALDDFLDEPRAAASSVRAAGAG